MVEDLPLDSEEDPPGSNSEEAVEYWSEYTSNYSEKTADEGWLAQRVRKQPYTRLSEPEPRQLERQRSEVVDTITYRTANF
jgi:hypothetical protein